MENTPEDNEVFKIASFIFDSENKILAQKGCFHKLTEKEAALLKLMYLNKNNVLTREYLLKTLWGDNNYFKGRSMDVYISKLRKYLKLDTDISIINIHGKGFKLEIKEN